MASRRGGPLGTGRARELLNQCGIGATSKATTDDDDEAAAVIGDGTAGQHRVLIFCQWKRTLDLIQSTVLEVRRRL